MASGGAPPPIMQQNQQQQQTQQQQQQQQFMANNPAAYMNIPQTTAAGAGPPQHQTASAGPAMQVHPQYIQGATTAGGATNAASGTTSGPPPPLPPQGYMYQGGAAGYGMPPGPMQPHGMMGGGVAAATTPGMMGGAEPVKNVWKWNLEEQMGVLRKLAEQFNYIFIDCKFPGIVARPIGTFKSTSEYHYQTLRSNVDILEVIQIGITITDEYGNQPPGGVATWQFNFKFDPNQDMGSHEGVELLRQSGIDFMKHEMEGIDPFSFAELLYSSGFVLNDQMNWVTFHSGYDLGYLLSILLNKEVPVEEKGFLKSLRKYFPLIYDVKYICKHGFNLAKSNLVEVAEELNVRVPIMMGINGLNQAGLDSLLTHGIFFNLKQQHPETVQSLIGHLFGLGDSTIIEESGLDNNTSSTNSTHHSSSHSQSAANLFQFGKMGGGA